MRSVLAFVVIGLAGAAPTWADSDDKQFCASGAESAMSLDPALEGGKLAMKHKVRESMRRLRSALKKGDLVALRRLIPAKGRLQIAIAQCIGESCDPVDKKTSWTRSAVRLDAFADVDIDQDLQECCIEEVDCEVSPVEAECRTGCGGYQGTFSWKGRGGALSLSAIGYEYD